MILKTLYVFCDAQRENNPFVVSWDECDSIFIFGLFNNRSNTMFACSYIILKYYQIGLYVRCSCWLLHLELYGIAQYFSVWLKVRKNRPVASSLAPVCPDLYPFAFSKHASLPLSLTQSFAGVSVVEQKQGLFVFFVSCHSPGLRLEWQRISLERT